MSEPSTSGAEPVPAQSQGWQELPLPEQAAAWERLIPGSAERILNQVEQKYEHERRVERIELRCRIAGMTVGTGGLAGVLWVAKYLVDSGQGLAGAGILGSGIAALAGALFARRNRP